ncbi:hypothetical protein GGH12_000998 [Coemansia sp. RSA 1822]|nr:hypothetical protein LPJ76_003032 [Coemansia sp. RSA 638]KAJ2124169.1 hypothetical protein IW147_001907 [Coemansia sp. RSA 720]KAJ2542328.1 hypothetical protein GGF49_002969 [Coemansia sp. RSA 1853]KAJ2566268.1 hypothetical protein GGH12_000998 [Coemansia sp. RSA 1822]
MIRLESSDGRLFAVDQDSAYMSSLLKNIDQDLGTDINPILLPNVTGTILARVIEYCMHHRDDVRLDKDVEDLLQDDNQVEAWDRQFMNVDDSTMLQILYAADYLGVEPLVDLGCMFIARIIRDMSVDEIRLRYGVVDDFTDAQRQQIQLEVDLSM